MIRHTAQAWQVQGLDPIERLVLLALADMANEQGQCGPTHRVMMERTGLEVQQLRDTLEALVELRLVRRLRDPWRWELTLGGS